MKEDTYKNIVDDITKFLNGGYKEIKLELSRKMEEAAENLEFERAKRVSRPDSKYRNNNGKAKNTMTDFTDRDVFGFSVDKGWMCVQVFFIRQGKLIET